MVAEDWWFGIYHLWEIKANVNAAASVKFLIFDLGSCCDFCMLPFGLAF